MVFSESVWALAFLVGWSLVTGALLWVGVRYIAKLKPASYLRYVWVSLLAGFIGPGFFWTLGFKVAAGGLSKDSFPWPLVMITTAACTFGLLIYIAVVQATLRIKTIKAGLASLPTIGLLVLVIAPVLVVNTLHEIEQDQIRAVRGMSATNLKGIGVGLALYAAINDDVYPPTLDYLLTTECASSKMLHYPGDESRRYFYYCPKGQMPSSMLMACEPRPHYKDKRWVLSVGGEVKKVTEPEFHNLLAKPENKAFAEAYRKAQGATRPAPVAKPAGIDPAKRGES